MFYGVQGVEIQDTDRVSFYNTSEVQEVVERVKELYDGWPPQWGPRQAKDIGVVVGLVYYDIIFIVGLVYYYYHLHSWLVGV
jgi:ABC-type glycerol-3-phosphate transport system substrate-binding protein